ncbi:MAG: hypothetical protein KDD73_04455 [Anaerolineales bacterium]|nr:hypothetical protein [Anaerolineales bacterium]MCB9126741.1 hypothetical protein [Ardenticatenales bacterium]
MTRYRSPLFYTLLFAALALLLTWPMPLHLATHAIGDGSDDPAILWNLWWVRYALLDLGQSPFESAWMFWPLGINLVFYTLTTLHGALTIPIQLLAGVVVANSFIVYFELIVAALGTWLLARWLLLQHPDAAPHNRRTRDAIAALSAISYAFVSSKWLYLSLGQFNIAASQWLPWATLYLARMWTQPHGRAGLRNALLCATFLLFTGWTEFTYAAFFAQFAILFWLWHVVVDFPRRRLRNSGRYTLLCALVGLIFLVGMAPILWLMVSDIRTSGDFLVEGLGFANSFSNDLLGFFVPSDQHPLFGAWVQQRFDFAYLNFAFLGWATLALVATALLWRGSRRYAASWLFTGGIMVLLSLGPTLRINGREWELPLPFDLMLQIPILKANRYPSRYSVVIALCVAMLVAWGASALLAGLKRPGGVGPLATERLVPFALALILLAEHTGVPLPLSDYRPQPVYEALAEREGAALLDLPLAWRNGFRVTGPLDPVFMAAQAQQIYHQKRSLNGNTSRNPPLKFQYFTELPVVNSLLALETGHTLPPDRQTFDRALAPELLRLLDAPNLVVRRLDQVAPVPVTPARAIPYLETVLPTTRWYEDAQFVGLGATLPRAPDRYEWDAAHPLARLFFAEGWSALPPLDLPAGPQTASYAQAERVRLLLPSIAHAGDWQLTMTITVPDGVTRRAELWLVDPAGGTGRPLTRLTLTGSDRYTVTIPADERRGTLTALQLRFDGLSPASGFTDGPSLLVESAQEEVGKFAAIYLNGERLNGRGTGYHAALFTPDFALIEPRHFDTFNDPAASAALAAWLAAAPRGTILALAAEDTVSAGGGTGGASLSDDVWAALQQWGATPISDMRGQFRVSHAFIGVKGEGAALEDASAIRPARRWIGAPLQAPQVAARFDSFVLVPAPP